MQLTRWVLLMLLITNMTIIDASASEVKAGPSHDQLFSFQAKYHITRNGSEIGQASISLSLSETEAFFDYHSKVSRFFLSDERTERSVYRFLDTNNSSIPITAKSYEYIRTGTGPDDQLFIDFVQQTIHNEDGFTAFTSFLNDNQFFRLDIPYRLNQGLTIPSEYEFFNYRGETRTYLVQQQNNQTLDLPIGQVTAHYFVITRPHSSRRVTHAWFAPDYKNQLVRLIQYKDEKEQADMRLKSFTADPSISHQK